LHAVHPKGGHHAPPKILVGAISHIETSLRKMERRASPPSRPPVTEMAGCDNPPWCDLPSHGQLQLGHDLSRLAEPERAKLKK
jgi:hypothetical protein